jgi:hypothetical protein
MRLCRPSVLCSLLPVLFSFFFLLSCEQPFKAGLGLIIDLQNPVIRLEFPAIGKSVRRLAEFRGYAADDTALDSVWFQISAPTNVDLPGYSFTDRADGRFYRITEISGDSRNWEWTFTINTLLLDSEGKRVFEDGTNLRIRLLAIDSVGKENYPLDEYPFLVKNDKPIISMTEPLITEGTDDGAVGSDHLNYGFKTPFPRFKDTESIMLGSILDNEGIYFGPVSSADIIDEQNNPKTVKLFPPQIRFWEVYMGDDPPMPDPENPYEAHQYRYDYFPTEVEEPWKNLRDETEFGRLSATDDNHATFQYDLWKKEGKYYGFEVRAQSVDRLHTSVTYPWDRDDPEPDIENKYVLICVRKPDEPTILELYGLYDYDGTTESGSSYVYDDGKGKWGLQDIYKDGFTPPFGSQKIVYKPLEIDKQDVQDKNHEIVDTSIVLKRGPFTLRMKASHSEGIDYAVAYWEKDDKSARGRFIWDQADSPMPPWNSVGIDKPYDTWSRNEPGSTAVHNFVFTYTDDPAQDIVPAGADSLFPGGSKVQRYRGGLTFDELEEERFKDNIENTNPARWEAMIPVDGHVLPEGTYYIYVYARSKSGSRVASPFNIELRIDRTEPEIGLNDIEGKASVIDESLKEPTVVNGVIRPKLRLSDSGPAMGFRKGSTDYFKRSDMISYYDEQAYILIKDSDTPYFNKYLDTNPWPEFSIKTPNTNTGSSNWTTDPMTINQGGGTMTKTVDILKHGPFDTADLRIKTSIIYRLSGYTETDALDDGVYRIYVFARDNAFNVGRLDFPIDVQLDSDNPQFDWAASIDYTGVTEPDSSYDWTAGSPEPFDAKSFIVKNGIVRNKFGASSSIQVKIRDDDSLDLGVAGGDDSKIKVTFTGSKPNASGVIEPLTGPGYELELLPADVKAAFPAQTLNGTVRIPVREITGTISQTLLLNLLKANSNYDDLFVGGKDGYNSLPDGIYRVGISISDYQDAKLKMDADTYAADVIPVNVMNEIILSGAPSPDKYFWIAVDSKNPEITIDEYHKDDNPGGKTMPNGTIIAKDDASPLAGTVSDENGPITFVDWRVLEGNNVVSRMGTPVPPNTPSIEITDPPLGAAVYSGGKWIYGFNYNMLMNGKDKGTYSFEIKFKDRFGNISTRQQTYSVDNEPPKVSLTKPIETFSRPFDDVDLKNGTYPQNPANAAANKERLAVKVVNFSINAVDNFGVHGVRWWLLPWNVGSGTSGYDSTGIVSGYRAFPSEETGYPGPGTYYPNEGGAYGVVDVEQRKFTIAVDSQLMKGGVQGNGEYRLHIIAIDNANNVSTYVNPPIIPGSYVFQEVFFLHEEDRPYFGGPDNITPGMVVEGAVWPAAADDMPVMGGNPVIRGTIFENNGFFENQSLAAFRPGSITIWFSDSDAVAAAALPVGWETSVEKGDPLTGYTMKQIPNDVPSGANIGLGKSGRGLSLAIELTTLFPNAFKTDGKKRYIIKATDSPVNKLWYEKEAAPPDKAEGIPMGNGGGGAYPSTQDEAVRVFRYRQFAFIYDAVPPKVMIDNPKNNTKFGTNFEDTTNGFNLVGSISDQNLEKKGGNYYFEYYLDSNTGDRREFILNNRTGVTVTEYLTDDPPKVEFNITPTIVAAEIIKNFPDLAEGQHTLNIFAWDKSGKEGAAWVTFIKDMKPPTIAFSNLYNNNKPYDTTNASKVDKGWWTTMSTPAKQTLLFGTSTAAPLPLTTISYDTGVPELRGTITDEVSNISLETDYDSNVGTGDVNILDSKFMYWIDGDSKARYFALIDGKGSKSVRWTILLTSDGTLNGTKLADGVHTIVLTAADEAGMDIKEPDQYMIAFRIDSKQPKAKVAVSGAPEAGGIVYGNATYQNSTMFTVSIEAEDANLDRAELRIVEKIEGKPDRIAVPTQTFNARNSTAWTYTPGTSGADDKVGFIGTYDVVRSLFNDVSDGKYEVIVASYDTAGNKSEEFMWPFTYDKTAPEIEFTNPPDENKNTAGNFRPQDFIVIDPATGAVIEDGTIRPNNKINRLTSEDLRIQGNVKDAFSAVIQVQSRVEKWNWDTTGAGAGTWVQVEDWKDVRDLSGNGQLQISWTKNLMGQSTGDLDLSGRPAGDAGKPITQADIAKAEGLYRVQIRAKDASTIQVPPGTNDWNTTTGKGNPVLSEYEYFYFDRTDPALVITAINGSTATTMATYYSKPADGFTFEGTIEDNSRFAKVEVKFVTAGGQTRTMNVSPANWNQGTAKQNWEAKFADAASYPDGKYTVTITAYDMAGRSAKQERSFILDSTPPGARFTLPAKEIKSKYTGNGTDSDGDGFASVYVNGGDTSIITGETWDRPGTGGENGSESGISQMWFRLGYIDGNNNFPIKTDIKNNADTLIAATKALAGNNGLTDNQLMDIVAEYVAAGNGDTRGNSWFKLGGIHKPTGFIIDNPNIYDWRMEIPKTLAAIPITHPDYADYNATLLNGQPIAGGAQIGGLKLYGSAITVKGRQYTVGPTPTGGRQMVRSVDGQAGVYRLPLWIRLVDIAGNVEYYCHDIWIYPDGDIPSTTIESPSNGTRYNARGGTISVDGVAKSNTSVYDVIFRVFADNVTDTNLDGIQTPVNGTNQPVNAAKTIGTNGTPGIGSLVTIKNYNPADPATVNLLPGAYKTTEWQKASLTMTGGSGEPLIPWSITLNAEDQIRNLISSSGFASGGGNPDMIRVWLEVFVFNGEGAPIRCSIYPNDNLNTGGGGLYGTSDPINPKPYVKAFYIKTGSAQITHPNVGGWNNGTNTNLRRNFNWNTEETGNQGGGGYKGAGTETRRDRFAFSATLDPNPSNTSGSGLGEVAYRIKLDSGAYGTWNQVWKTGDTAITAANPYNSNGVYIVPRDTTGNRVRYYFDYAVNSKAAGTTTESGIILAAINNGNWANSGGTISVQVRMKDNSTPPNEAEQTIQVRVDNFAPVRDANYETNPKVAGSNVDFMGRVYDYATAPPTDAMARDDDNKPKKLAGVYAWFTKVVNGQTRYVNMNDGTTTQTLTGTRTITATTANSRTATIAGGGVNDAVSNITITNRGTSSAITYPGLGGKQAHNADYVRDISESTATPGTKMLWSPVNSAVYDVRWSFTLDSTLLPDGDLTLNYIVVDAAGNASYYTQGPITVKNKYPVIERLTLYTVNLGIGAAYTQPDQAAYNVNDYRSEMFNDLASNANTTGYLNSGFISKNSYIGFRVETEKGNRPLTFRLQHVKRTMMPLNQANLDEWLAAKDSGGSNINLYTIAAHGDYSSANWKAIGVHEDNPTLGTHFVLQQPPPGTEIKYSGGSAQVWKYTLQGTTKQVTPTNAEQPSQGQDPAVDPVVIEQENFKFDKSPDFDTISEYYGSHRADSGDTIANDPTDTAFFLIRVWDSVGKPVPGTQTETWINDQLYDALVVGMNVYKTDKTPPVARLYDLNPYTETTVTGNNLTEANRNSTIRNAADPQALGSNIVRGGLFNTGTNIAMVRSGFIDPRDQSKALNPSNTNGVTVPDYPLKVSTDTVPTAGTNRDKVSGRIILRGLAWDDQLINEISVSINGTPTPILRLNPATAKMEAVSPAQAYAVETLNWKTGHTVEWAYVWNTGDNPSTNVPVRVIVEDYNTPPRRTSPDLSTATDTDTTFHNQVYVDIVPYITGFERKKPEFTTKRSLQGWYSFYQGESGIKVKGYNFGTTAGGTMTLNTTNITLTGASSTERTFNIPATGVASGAITVNTGTGAAYAAYNNNSTSAGKSWNREYSAYTPGSDLWINRPYAHIWRSEEGTAGGANTYFAGTNDSGGMDSPALKASPGMALQYNGPGAGRLHAVWARYNLDTISYGDNAGTYRRLNRSGDPYAFTDMDYYNAGNDAFNNNVSTVALYQRDGGGRLILRPTTTERDVNGGDDASIVVGAGPPNDANNNGRQPQSTDTERYQNPRIKKLAASTADANPGTVIISSFDSYDKRLHYTRQSGALNNANGATFGTVNLQYFLDGGTLNDHNNLQNLGNVNIFSAGITNSNTGGAITRSNSAGKYSAIDYDSNSRPVIAYFDDQNQTLRLLYANSDNPTSAAAWTRRYVLPVGHQLRVGSGSYVSMKIQRTNEAGNGTAAQGDADLIHLAFYNSDKKAVVYAVGTRTGSFTASIIDRVVEGGQWTDISLDQTNNPWVVYADSARTGSRDGVRIAYKSSGAGAFTRDLIDPVTGVSVQGWEAMTMPADFKVNNDRLNIAVWPPKGYTGSDTSSPLGNWHAAVGYGSDKFRIGYFFKPVAAMQGY